MVLSNQGQIDWWNDHAPTPTTPTVEAKVLAANQNQVFTPSAAEFNLSSLVVPATTLPNTNDMVQLEAMGGFANNANVKYLRLRVNGNIVGTAPLTVSISGLWVARAHFAKQSNGHCQAAGAAWYTTSGAGGPITLFLLGPGGFGTAPWTLTITGEGGAASDLSINDALWYKVAA